MRIPRLVIDAACHLDQRRYRYAGKARAHCPALGQIGDVGALRRRFPQVVERPVLRLFHLAVERQVRGLRRRGRDQPQRSDEGRRQARNHRHRRYFATITSDALMKAIASSPTARPRSSIASLVIDAVTTTPLPISIRTCAVVLALLSGNDLAAELVACAEFHGCLDISTL